MFWSGIGDDVHGGGLFVVDGGELGRGFCQGRGWWEQALVRDVDVLRLFTVEDQGFALGMQINVARLAS